MKSQAFFSGYEVFNESSSTNTINGNGVITKFSINYNPTHIGQHYSFISLKSDIDELGEFYTTDNHYNWGGLFEVYSDVSIVPPSFGGRTNNVLGTVNLASKKVTISVWDHGSIDGDIVSIYVNGVRRMSKNSMSLKIKSIIEFPRYFCMLIMRGTSLQILCYFY